MHVNAATGRTGKAGTVVTSCFEDYVASTFQYTSGKVQGDSADFPLIATCARLMQKWRRLPICMLTINTGRPL